MYQLINWKFRLKCPNFTDGMRILGGYKILANFEDRWESLL